MLREGLANVAKREQLEQMIVQIKGNSAALVSLEWKVDSTNETNKRRFQIIEEKLDQGPIEDRGRERTDPRQAAFDKARRSMRIWPIDGEDQHQLNAAFRDFAVEALLVSDTVVRTAGITDVIRVRSSPQGNVYKEILVSFRDPQERDYYFSKAKNLACFRDKDGNPTADIRMDVTPYLLPTFKLLNEHGFDIRNVHRRETK